MFKKKNKSGSKKDSRKRSESSNESSCDDPRQRASSKSESESPLEGSSETDKTDSEQLNLSPTKKTSPLKRFLKWKSKTAEKTVQKLASKFGTKRSSSKDKSQPTEEEEEPKALSPIKYVDSSYRSPMNVGSIPDEYIIVNYLETIPCYNLMPLSNLVLVLTTDILVKSAFEAFAENGLREAPLYNAQTDTFTGVFTVQDFLNIMRYYCRNIPEDVMELEAQPIATWKQILNMDKYVSVEVTDDAAKAAKLLLNEDIDNSIPVLDVVRNSVLYLLSHKILHDYTFHNIIKQFGDSIDRTPQFLCEPIYSLGVGTYDDIATVTFDTTVVEALDFLVERRISALPIVDENNVVVETLTKYDIFNFAKVKNFFNTLASELDFHIFAVTIEEAINEILSSDEVDREDTFLCYPEDNLGTVIYYLVNNSITRLIVKNEQRNPIGIVTISDVLKYLIAKPLDKIEEIAESESNLYESPEGAVGGVEGAVGSIGTVGGEEGAVGGIGAFGGVEGAVGGIEAFGGVEGAVGGIGAVGGFEVDDTIQFE